MTSVEEMTQEEARCLLWEDGELRWKLHSTQQEMYSTIEEQEQDVITLLCSRRLGKSFLLCLLASETCLKKPNSIVKYACPKQKMVFTIIKPIMKVIFEDAPDHLKPEFKTQDKVYLFPNGSEIQLAGTDNGNHENLRGGFSDLCIVDEAGFCDELEYVVHSVLAPTTDTTDGQIILASTPSKTPDHEFITEFMMPLEVRGELIKYTIYDNPLLTPEKINKIIERYKNSLYPDGVSNPQFRREYLCEVVQNDEDRIIPEFTDKVEKDIVREWERPPFYDTYVAMDVGSKDLTVVLFAYYDFKNAALIIEDEIVMNGPKMTTDVLAKAIKEKEKELWGSKEVTLRVSDNNLILINDLIRLHDLSTIATDKHKSENALNEVRIKIADRAIIINPKCKTLIYHLKNGIWNSKRTSFERNAALGHCDAIDAIKYLIRNVDYLRNPYPPGYLDTDRTYYPYGPPMNNDLDNTILDMFNWKRAKN